MSSKSFILQKKRDESFRKAHVKKVKPFLGSNLDYCRQDRLQSFPHSKEYKRKLGYVKHLNLQPRSFSFLRRSRFFQTKMNLELISSPERRGFLVFLKERF